MALAHEPNPIPRGRVARLRHLRAADHYVNQVVVRRRLLAVLTQHLHQLGRACVLVPEARCTLNHMFADLSAPRADDPCGIIERTVIDGEAAFEATHEGRRGPG